MSEVDPRKAIEDRIAQLEERRHELEERLKKELDAALAPLDASIRELRWMLSQLTGQAAPPPNYNLVKRQPPVGTAPPTQGAVYPFQPRRSEPTAEMPPPEVVMSPKSNTPVLTNAGMLKKKIQGG